MKRSKQIRGLPFETTLPDSATERDDFREAFYTLREDAVDIPEMTLEEINAEIAAARNERKRENL